LRWPVLRLVPALVVFGLALVVGVWQGVTVILAMRTDGDTTPWAEPMLWEITGVLAAAACIWIPMTAVLNAPIARRLQFVAIHLAAFAMYVPIKESLMLAQRYALYPLLGWGSFHYRYTAEHLAMEAMKDALGYAVMATAYSLYRVSRERQERALREARLAAELRETRLQALAGQLNPHFLMNALNTISSTMFEDLARTDHLLADLGTVLRAGFEAGSATWTFAEERAHTARFVALLEARFTDRLRVEWDVQAGLDALRVPRFALQVLVENAVKHNQDRPEPLALRIHAGRAGDAVELVVDDTGRGFAIPSPAPGAGHGLRHLAEVLALLYGERAHFAREASPEGGARARISLPAEVA
jgi:two-component system, LytTR family, sensor kinase